MIRKIITITLLATSSWVAANSNDEKVIATAGTCGPIQPGWNLIYENDANGIPTPESDLELLKTLIHQGADIKVGLIFLRPYESYTAITCSNVAFNHGLGVCMNTDHISIAHDPDNNRMRFQSNPYHWFVLATTDGFLDQSRWEVTAGHRDRGHTDQQIAMHWFAKCI